MREDVSPLEMFPTSLTGWSRLVRFVVGLLLGLVWSPRISLLFRRFGNIVCVVYSEFSSVITMGGQSVKLDENFSVLANVVIYLCRSSESWLLLQQ